MPLLRGMSPAAPLHRTTSTSRSIDVALYGDVFRAPGSKGEPAAPRSVTDLTDPVAERFLLGVLPQVRRYFTDDTVRARAPAAVDARIGSDTTVLVGHSLGSVVARTFSSRVVYLRYRVAR
ncbi:hypothetical protein ACWEP4_23145 [Streptomyces sp. NPDC004227]